MNKEYMYVCVCVYVCVYTNIYIHCIYSIPLHLQCNGILFTHKKNEILLIATTWMDLKGIMLNAVSQTEKDK